MREFDFEDKYSIEKFAMLLEGESLSSLSLVHFRESGIGGKGQFGQLIERDFFGYEINSNQEADFKEAGVELKVVPVKSIQPQKSSKILSKRNGFSVKERMVLTIINYESLVNEQWENNSLFSKIENLLIMFYHFEMTKEIYEYKFLVNRLWTPPEDDLKIIKEDWNYIKEKVANGAAHELSEGDTLYLGACTKGANRNSLRTQPFNSLKAMQRAFSYKRNYVDRIFNDLYSLKHGIAIPRIHNSIYSSIIKEFSKYENLTIKQIMKMTGLNLERLSKSYISLVTNALFKIDFNITTKEFNEINDAGIEIKNILLQTNNVPKESMSFEQIKYNEIINEEWYTSDFRKKFEEKKMLWVVYKASRKYSRQSELSDEDISFVKAFYWNISIDDLDVYLKNLWEDTVKKIKLLDFDNFVGSRDNPVGHVRPKAKDKNDLYRFITGELVPKKSFWLNNHYVGNEIKKKLNEEGKYLY